MNAPTDARMSVIATRVAGVDGLVFVAIGSPSVRSRLLAAASMGSPREAAAEWTRGADSRLVVETRRRRLIHRRAQADGAAATSRLGAPAGRSARTARRRGTTPAR